MMPFQLFILTIMKRVRKVDPSALEHQTRVQSMMDEAHDKSANFMNMM